MLKWKLLTKYDYFVYIEINIKNFCIILHARFEFGVVYVYNILPFESHWVFRYHVVQIHTTRGHWNHSSWRYLLEIIVSNLYVINYYALLELLLLPKNFVLFYF